MGMENKTVSLVLGSGGARGLAHIGVIDVLEEKGFEIHSISGSSMGALIGGIYAAGKLQIYSDWVQNLERLDVIRLLDFSFGGAGLFKGRRIIGTLKDLIGDCNIEELPIAFTAVATDLEAEKEVWLSRGPLFDAIWASIAFPTIFNPKIYQGRRLIDGGLINPIPIAPTLRDRTDLTIAVNLSGRSEEGLNSPTEKMEPDQPGKNRQFARLINGMLNNGTRKDDEVGMLEVLSKSLDVLQNTVARFQLAAYSPDLVIEIPKNASTFYEFQRARELISIGRSRAEKALGWLADRKKKGTF
jgi:NTE family protein